MQFLAMRASHCEELMELSAKMAKGCSDHCKQHRNAHCQECATACGKWAQDVHQIINQMRT